VRPPATAETCWFAPGRVNLIGEHTDYNDGYVLPIALPLGVTAGVRVRADRRLVVVSANLPGQTVETSLADLVPGSVRGWGAYVVGVVWALRERGLELPGADVWVHGTVPRGAGLSSSAALECAVAAALNHRFELGLTRGELVDVACRAENDFVEMPSGTLDQSAAMLCTAGHALFLDTRTGQRRQIRFDLAAAGLRLVVIDTNAPHRLVDSEYAARRRDCERASGLLHLAALRDLADDQMEMTLARLPNETLRRRVRHVVTENARVLATVAALDDGRDPRDIGPLLTSSHVSLRDDYEVSCRELDIAVEAALEAGAYGARMTGGGFGGSAIALVDRGGVQRLVDHVQNRFTSAGLASPDLFAVTASDGARRKWTEFTRTRDGGSPR
jgi:galactokinase